MKINKYSSKFMGTNCYLINNNDQILLIDPCIDYNELKEEEKIRLCAIIITHAHFDHFEKLESYLHLNLPIYMHKNGYPKLIDSSKNCAVLIGKSLIVNVEDVFVNFVDENSEINLLDKKIKFLYTPGHSDCSISILIDNYMFSGDLLFAGSVGRYDLYSSSYLDLMISIKKLKSIDINYNVMPGHGPDTTLDHEKNHNPYFR